LDAYGVHYAAMGEFYTAQVEAQQRAIEAKVPD
jgi:hypothetical protein